MIDLMPHDERIRRYIEDFGKLSARHGIWIESGARGTLLRVREYLAAGYHAWPWPGGGCDGVCEIYSYVRGAVLDGDGVNVVDRLRSVSHYPYGLMY